MAVLAKVFAAMAAFGSVALASNSTGNATTTATATLTATTTGTTTTTFTETITNTITTTAAGGVQMTQQITGTISMTITGNCATFISDPDVGTAFTKAIAGVASVDKSWVDVVLSHTCSRRMSEWGEKIHGRRLGGSVVATYTITFPVGTSVTTSSVVNAITSTTDSAWTTTVAAKLTDEGVSAYSVTVTGTSTPQLSTVPVTTRTTTTTTLQSALDSSAFLHKAFSSAHLTGLLILLVSSKLFA